MTRAYRETDWVVDENPGFQTRDIIRFFMVDIILVVLLKLLLGLGFFPSVDFYVFAILASKIVLLVYLIWLVRDHRDAWPATGATTMGRWWGWIIAIFAYAGAYPFLIVVDRFSIDLLTRIYGWFGRLFVPQAQDAVILIFDNIIQTPARLALVLFTVLVGPIMEELAFRGVGLDAYRRRHGMVTALLWTSFLFGLYHLTMQLIIPLSVMGALFGIARVVSGSLWCAVTVHCLHNFLSLALTARHLGIIDFPWFS